jgi:hypothetical protein
LYGDLEVAIMQYLLLTVSYKVTDYIVQSQWLPKALAVNLITLYLFSLVLKPVISMFLFYFYLLVILHGINSYLSF